MRIGGLASGFDTEQIVNQLMEVERLPLDRIYQQKVRTEWQRDQYRALMTKITSFRDLVFNMQLQSTYLVRQVSSSDESAVKAQVVGNAPMVPMRSKSLSWPQPQPRSVPVVSVRDWLTSLEERSIYAPMRRPKNM